MKFKNGIFLAILVLLTSGCYAEMTGVVVDAETGQPIEGAVVLVEWTITKGIPGMKTTEPYKVVEEISDNGGRVTILGVQNSSVDAPRVTIYKKGYVAWNNEYIFPGWEKRNDFKWGKELTIKLEPFRENYSRNDHVYFLHSITHWGKLMEQAYRWEELEKERGK